MTTVTYTASEWTLSDGSVLTLDATIKAHVGEWQVTLIDAFRDDSIDRVAYWQRTALVDWVQCHQNLLRWRQSYVAVPQLTCQPLQVTP